MAVYWVGADGNVWFKDNSGTRNVGKPINVGDHGFDSERLSGVADRIADPNPPASSAPANPNNTQPGPAPVDKSNDIALQRAGLGAVDTQTAAGLAAVERALHGLFGQYDTEAGSNETNYSTNSNQNQTNLQKNKQSAMVNAAQGRQGLFGTLASLGALSGSGLQLANKAVQTGANEDLAGAAENFSTNQSGLDTSIGAFRQADKERRQQAETAAENAKTRVTGESAKSKQSFYSNLANDYAAMGNSGEAAKYTGLASDLYPAIAGANVPSSDLGYTGAAYTPASLSSYLSGSNSTAVGVAGPRPGTGPSSLPGLFASDTRKKLQKA